MQGRQIAAQHSVISQDDELTLNIQRNLSMLLKSEVNSPENSGEADEEDDLDLQDLDFDLEQDVNVLSHCSRGGSITSDGGDDCCTSQCASPCRNPRHIEAQIASEIMG